MEHAMVHSIACAPAAMVTAFALAAAAGAGMAQDYPVKSIRIVVPFSAGGGTDLVARVTAQKLTAALGQSVIVDNRPGASGNIAAEIVAKAPPDGYTLLFGNSSLAIVPAVFGKLSFDPVKDLTPLSMVSSYPFVLTVHPSLPVRSVKEMVALARAKPDALAYSSAGAGTMSHFAMELLRLSSSIRIIHLPYKGAAPAMVALVSGEAQVAFLVLPVAQPQAQTGRLRALGIAGPARVPGLPKVPTMHEAGVDRHEAMQWNGLFATARTPQAVIDRLHREVVSALGDPEVKQRLEAEGATPVGSAPAQFSAYFTAEAAKWGDVARRSGTRLD